MDKNKIIESALDELDEMLAEHEKFKKEYGKKYQNLSKEKRVKEQVEELQETYDFIEKTGMKKETIKVDKR